MKSRFSLLVETQRRNTDLTQWPAGPVFDAYKEPQRILDAFHEQAGSIRTSPHLTSEGKQDALMKAARIAVESLQKWNAPRIAGLEADLGVHRMALLPASESPDARRVDFMLDRLKGYDPDDIARFYSQATIDEQALMEAAAASVSRVPTKTAGGKLEWRSLLDPATVAETIMARASRANPEGARKLEELTSIRQMHITLTASAINEVRDVLAGQGLDGAQI